MEIMYLSIEEIARQIGALIDKICLMYDLQEPADGFKIFMGNTIKKHYGYLTFEQIETAFEYNAIRSLDEFLPRSGFSADNKVKFTIPDVTKIIKAFVKLKGLKNEDTQTTSAGPSLEMLNNSRQEWCSQLLKTFEQYCNYSKTLITLPIFTCEVLVQIGLLERRQIDYSDKRINIKMVTSARVKSSNEDLIYQTFDNLLRNNQTLAQHLEPYQNKYLSQMI